MVNKFIDRNQRLFRGGEISDKAIENMFICIDFDHSNSIEYVELQAAMETWIDWGRFRPGPKGADKRAIQNAVDEVFRAALSDETSVSSLNYMLSQVKMIKLGSKNVLKCLKSNTILSNAGM